MLDTEAGPNFVVESVLPPQLRARIRTYAIPDISDANNTLLTTVGTIALVVRLGQLMEFMVFTSLAAPVIFGCDYCQRFVEAI